MEKLWRPSRMRSYKNLNRMHRLQMQMHHQAIAGSSQQHFNPSLASGALPAELDGVPADLITIPEMSNNIFTEALMAPPNPSTETLHENSLDDNNMIDFDALI